MIEALLALIVTRAVIADRRESADSPISNRSKGFVVEVTSTMDFCPLADLLFKV